MKQKKALLSKNDGNARKVFCCAADFFALLIKDASSGVFYEKILNKRNWQEVLAVLEKIVSSQV